MAITHISDCNVIKQCWWLSGSSNSTVLALKLHITLFSPGQFSSKISHDCRSRLKMSLTSKPTKVNGLKYDVINSPSFSSSSICRRSDPVSSTNCLNPNRSFRSNEYVILELKPKNVVALFRSSNRHEEQFLYQFFWSSATVCVYSNFVFQFNFFY